MKLVSTNAGCPILATCIWSQGWESTNVDASLILKLTPAKAPADLLTRYPREAELTC
jgi:hypothetical protein